MKSISKRIIVALLLAAMLIPATSCDRIAAAQKRRQIEKNAFAPSGLELMEKICSDYYSAEKHTLSNEPRGTEPTTLWPFASFLEALADTYALFPSNELVRSCYSDALDNGLKKYKVVAASLNTPSGEYKNITYYNASAGNRGDFYYDDNAWICLQLIRASQLLGEEKYLTEAEKLLEFFKTGWDDTLGGGIYWDKSFTSKNTCADGPIAVAFLKAYKITNKSDYLDWAGKIYSWTKSALLDTDGLYSDNISSEGEINSWKAYYNQGTMLCAASMLWEITAGEDYADDAKNAAAATLDLAFDTVGTGEKATVVMNGNGIYRSWCVGWLVRGFAEYIAVSGDKECAFFTNMETVLARTMEKKKSDGYYDPYFRTGGWAGENKTEVLQPCGVCCVMQLCAAHDVGDA